MSSKHALTSEPILPTIWRLGLPNMVAMVASAGVSIAETTYVGQLGTLELAGMALVFPMIMLQQMLSAGSMGGGISAAISRATGAGDRDKANALVLHATVISLVLGLLFSALFLVWGRPISVDRRRWCGASPRPGLRQYRLFGCRQHLADERICLGHSGLGQYEPIFLS